MTIARGAFTVPAFTTIVTAIDIPVAGATTLVLQFVVTTASLTALDILFQCHPGSGFGILPTATGDFTTPVFPVRRASGDLNAAAAGTTVHWLIMDVSGQHTVRIQASAGSAATMAGYWGVS